MFWWQKAWHSLLRWKQKDTALFTVQFTACIKAATVLTDQRLFPGDTCHTFSFGGGLAIRYSVGTIWPWFCYDQSCRKTSRLVALCSWACGQYSLNLSFLFLPFSGVSSIGNLMTICQLSSTYNYWTYLRFAKELKYRLASSVSFSLWLSYGFATLSHLVYMMPSKY